MDMLFHESGEIRCNNVRIWTGINWFRKGPNREKLCL